MFGGKAKQYPHLVNYLHHASRPQIMPLPIGALPARPAIGLFGMWAAVTAVGIGMQHAEIAAPAALVAVGLGALIAVGKRKPPTPPAAKEVEARETALHMRKLLELRRLHRDLDEASMTLLEECARHWQRVQNIFGSGFWSGDHLPPAYSAAREQALAMAEQGMQDVMILYRPCLPVQVAGRGAFDYVEEALEQYVFRGTPTAVHPPPAFEPARIIAERLRDLANEAERIASDLGRERVSAPLANTAGLEASLSELRAIRQAEDELRENLRG